MSRKRRRQRWEPPTPAQVRANRARRYPVDATLREKLTLLSVELLARAQEWLLTHVLREPIWRSQSGEVKRLHELGDAHLKNILRAGRRGDLEIEFRLWQALLEEEKKRRGAWLDHLVESLAKAKEE